MLDVADDDGNQKDVDERQNDDKKVLPVGLWLGYYCRDREREREREREKGGLIRLVRLGISQTKTKTTEMLSSKPSPPTSVTARMPQANAIKYCWFTDAFFNSTVLKEEKKRLMMRCTKHTIKTTNLRAE